MKQIPKGKKLVVPFGAKQPHPMTKCTRCGRQSPMVRNSQFACRKCKIVFQPKRKVVNNPSPTTIV